MKLNIAIVLLAIACVLVWTYFFTEVAKSVKEDLETANPPLTIMTERG